MTFILAEECYCSLHSSCLFLLTIKPVLYFLFFRCLASEQCSWITYSGLSFDEQESCILKYGANICKISKDVVFGVCSFHSVLSILSFLCKAPLVPRGTPLVNALFRQRACIDNILRACVGLPPINNMLLEYKHEKMVGNNIPEPVSSAVESTSKLDHKHDTKMEAVPVVPQHRVKVNHQA